MLGSLLGKCHPASRVITFTGSSHHCLTCSFQRDVLARYTVRLSSR